MHLHIGNTTVLTLRKHDKAAAKFVKDATRARKDDVLKRRRGSQ
jgi:hypothetical protein